MNPEYNDYKRAKFAYDVYCYYNGEHVKEFHELPRLKQLVWIYLAIQMDADAEETKDMFLPAKKLNNEVNDFKLTMGPLALE